MFSYHPNLVNLGREGMYANGWRASATDDPRLIASWITKGNHSAITWRNGQRKQCFFLAANWLQLDFDNGEVTLESALAKFGHLRAIIATSKSHGIAKGDAPACDRFHVYAQLERVITDAKEYEACTRYYAMLWGADLNACDAARKFNKCKSIPFIGDHLPLGKNMLEVKTYYAPTRQTVARKDDETKDNKLPKWVQRVLDEGDFSGSRNKCAFRMALQMKLVKMPQSEAVDMLMRSKIPINTSDELRREITLCVRNAYNQ